MQTESPWHLGPVTFSPWSLLAVLLLAGVLWLLASVCIRFKWARVPMLLLPVGLGAWVGINALIAPHGYAVGYSFGAIYALGILTGVAAGVLLPWSRTRRAGALGLVAAAVMFATFYVVYLVGVGLDQHRWQHKERVEIPATQQ